MSEPNRPGGDPAERRCATCAAFTRVRDDERLGRVGECALEVFPPPLRATAVCTRWRGAGQGPSAPRPRAAGEPRRMAAVPARSPDIRSPDVRSPDIRSPDIRSREPGAAAPAVPLPQEIDIDMDIEEFRRVLREVITEEMGISRPPLGARWQGGELVVKPGREGIQEKRVPIETFFHKLVMVRDKLRLLEAKVNAHPALSAEDKVQLQAYVTGCYGSLTTFNVLFSDKDDQFSGASGQGE